MGNAKTILVVEDSQAWFRLLTRLLEKMSYSVAGFEDLEEAERYIRSGMEYNLALVDLTIHGRESDGLIRLSKQVNPIVPIITMSGWDGYRNENVCAHYIKGPDPDKLNRFIDLLWVHML